MARSSSSKLLVLLLVVLELSCAALLKGKLPISTPCSQCMESYIADRDDNPQRIQSYIINGIKYGKNAAYFASVFANSFPFYYTKTFLNKLQDMQWRVDNHVASCGGQAAAFFDDDLSTSYIFKKIHLRVLEGSWGYRYMGTNHTTLHKSYLRYLNRRLNTRIYYKYYNSLTKKEYNSDIILFQFKLYLNSMNLGSINTFYNCAKWLKNKIMKNQTAYDQYMGYLPLQNPEMKGDYVYTLEYLRYYQYENKVFDLPQLQKNPPDSYYSIGSADPQALVNEECEIPLELNDGFYQRRLLQTMSANLSIFNIPLESLKPGQPSIMSPLMINMLSDINMAPDMFDLEGDPLVWDSSDFGPGESPYTVWADFAAMMFGPVLYCRVPGIIDALKASCPGTCAA